jgi:uncharacterized protein (DUF2236 family)
MAGRSSDANEPAGFFDPGGVTWKVNREAVLLLGGPRALLLQLAHPLVAAGVADHSRFEREPLTRLGATLDAMLGIVFGDRDTACALARRIDAVHERVRGTLTEGTAVWPAGTAYNARDPALLLWVHATLVDTALVAYECFVGSLSGAERACFYEESKIVAGLLGVPSHALPPDHAEFADYVDAMVGGAALEVTPTARRLAHAVLYPRIAWLPGPLCDLGKLVTVALLPAALRERYGFAWTGAQERAWRWTRAAVRAIVPVLPDLVRVMPQARAASRVRAGAVRR